jgi:hypothetical protein
MSELWEALVRLLQRLEPLEQTLHLPKLEIDPSGDIPKFWEALNAVEARITELENRPAPETPNEEQSHQQEESV